MRTSSQIRQDFLDFFRSKEHKIVPSAPVIPYNDPTLLFTNAGMNQFKDVFLGMGKRDYNRAADTQKCIRVSGKHNDLEEVGHDAYHHTFFEMLGNWSFGDYGKKEAIKWAWELLTKVWKMPKDKLWATVFRTDDEAYELWQSETDIDPAHILRFDEKDNFWEMGDTGPCGPCSEIHIDLTKDGCKPEDVNADNPDVMEIWNLVFIQYNRDEKGVLHPLPMKHVDTGMGFERVVRVLQNKKSNYETDVFLPLINEIIHVSKKDYTGDKNIAAMNVVADHIRTLTFAIADGAIPSNESRGYVLRRILRRAARYGRNLNLHEPFMYKLVDVLVETMGDAFPEIREKHEFIKEVIQAEEESFNVTLDRGIHLFNEVADAVEDTTNKVFPGEEAFKLYDTYGFPLDLTQLMANERGLQVDLIAYEEAMKGQKSKSRAARKETIGVSSTEMLPAIQINYDPYSVGPEGIKTSIETVVEDAAQLIVLKDNPFYAESGGQVSDTGKIIVNGEREIEVVDSKKDYIVIKDADIIIPEGAEVIAKVDYGRREAIERNHSATHLLHEALRRVLGPHVKQMGSYLDDKVLRFDFPHFHKLEQAQIKEIEGIVMEKIAQGINVNWEVMPIETAEKIPNVKKFFGDKYGDNVRVVIIDEKFSVEFCGGTHVKETSEIGLFKIIREESISSGTRRIFARTGEGILHLMDEKIADIEKLVADLPEKYADNFRIAIDEFKINSKDLDFRDIGILSRILEYHDKTISSLMDLREKYLEERKQAEKALAKQKVKEASDKLDEVIAKAADAEGIKIVTAKYDFDSMEELKDLGDILRSKLTSGVGLLYIIKDGKVNFVTVVTDDLIKEKGLSAGKLAGEVAKILGGGGGGKPHLAAAGGKDVGKIDFAITELKNIVLNQIKK
ncbi:MAG: alanine--tRNA ligase [Ignavibacteriae bacterium]|nr:MAG: alanine--tRNA ligase [Ignavibacteriota bacterium]